MNEYTFSAGEDFVDAMKANTDAVFIGSNTAGSSGQPLFISLESGGSFRICTMRCLAQNGEDIYNTGFSPDIRVERSLADYIEGRDPALEKAIAVLKEKAGFHYH
jgi:C-terminal processing protease CtpA/Prc